MGSELLIYQQNSVKTYLYFIHGNFKLIKDLNIQKNNDENWSLLKDESLYEARAKHLQLMSLIGITAEHLIKLILLKRNYILNKVEPNKYSEKFRKELEEYNDDVPSQNKLDGLYSKAEKETEIKYSNNLRSFEDCLKLFKKSNSDDYNSNDYYMGIGKLKLNKNIPNYRYLGFKEMTGSNCLKVIQQMRNSYLHKAEGLAELNGIIWYMYNFILWLAKKEYSEFFKNEEYIGCEDNIKLFKKEPKSSLVLTDR